MQICKIYNKNILKVSEGAKISILNGMRLRSRGASVEYLFMFIMTNIAGIRMLGDCYWNKALQIILTKYVTCYVRIEGASREGWREFVFE